MLKSEVSLRQTLSRALIPFRSILEMLANFFCEVLEKKKKVVVLSSRPAQNVKSSIFTYSIRAVTANKCTKKRDSCANSKSVVHLNLF